MTLGYKKIFLGVFIATFNIKFGIITILPAFVGWIVVLTSFSEFEKTDYGRNFSRLRINAMMLVAASLGGGIWSLIANNNAGTFLPLMYYPLFLLALELMLFHKILEESVHCFNAMNQQDIADKYTGKDRIYIILTGISMALLAITYTINHELTGLLGAILVIISRGYLLSVMNALSKEERLCA